MPVKIPFLDASQSLQQRWIESTSPKRISAQIYVFILLITVGLLRHYLFSPVNKRTPDYTYGTSCPDPTSFGAKDETIGEIDAIYIYPIKSCSGVCVPQAQLTQQGFELDRRWMIVRQDPHGNGVHKISLREEPKLTLIQPVITEEENKLRLTLTQAGQEIQVEKGSTLGAVETETLLRPSKQQLVQWKQVSRVEMYGDYADGRVAVLPDDSTCKLTPSEWISKFLGYSVLLLHFDTCSTTVRNAFPIFKPPTDASCWSLLDQDELNRKRGIEFQDEYPLLITSLSSLSSLRSQLCSILASPDHSDTQTGRTMTGIDATKWTNVETLSMLRFRPNIVIKGNLQPFNEDSWERIWILPSTQNQQTLQGKQVKAILQLVARCQRCLLTAVDPITAEKDSSIPLKLLNRTRMRVKKSATILGGNDRPAPCFGMYAIPLLTPSQDLTNTHTYGQLHQRDKIRVRWRPYHLDDEPNRN